MKLIHKIKKKVLCLIPAYKKRQRLLKIHPDMKVLVAGLMLCKNFGDVVISDCTSYLINKVSKECGVKKLKLSHLDIRREKDKANLNRVRNSDLVVFPGGGFIKYKQENFPTEMGRITDRAEHYGIPVMYNAMGIEDYNGEHEGCLKIQNMLRCFSNRYVTTRDFEKLLNNTYLADAHLKARRVADPAVWCTEVYDVKKDENSEVIGLGVARAGLFVDHDVPINGEALLVIWENIIKELDQRGIRWKLFTNGLRQDEEFLTALLEHLSLTDKREEVTFPAPETSRDLVENIASCKALIATRMHANIIAFSLGIPSVGFIWNDKLRYFMQSIECPERGIEPEHLNDAQFIMNAFEKAVQEGVSSEVIEREKLSAYNSVKGYIKPFSEEFLKSRRRDLTKIKLVCYGLPNLESEKLNHQLFEEHVEYFVSDDETLVNTTCLGKPVYSSKKLKGLRRKPFVIISETIDYTPAAKTLISWGYKERYHFTNMHAYKRYAFKKANVFVSKPTVK